MARHAMLIHRIEGTELWTVEGSGPRLEQTPQRPEKRAQPEEAPGSFTRNKKLLGAPGIATRKKPLGTKGIATRSKDATRLEAIASRLKKHTVIACYIHV